MIPELSNRLSSQRAACKQWSAALGVIILLFGGLAGLNPTKMLWTAGPLLLIGLVEAGYAAQERRCAEILKTKRGTEETTILLPEAASASVVRTTFAALSLSIWPFYLGLFAIVAVGGQEMAASNQKALLASRPQGMATGAMVPASGMVRTAAASSNCGSGGCGSAGGCGSGSCGASSGASCSCGGGAAPAQVKRPMQPYMQTASAAQYPMQGVSQPMQRPIQQMQPMQQQGQGQRLPNGAIMMARPPMSPANPVAMGGPNSIAPAMAPVANSGSALAPPPMAPVAAPIVAPPPAPVVTAAAATAVAPQAAASTPAKKGR